MLTLALVAEWLLSFNVTTWLASQKNKLASQQPRPRSVLVSPRFSSLSCTACTPRLCGQVECADSTPINTAHAAQCSLFTSAERVARAWLKKCITSFCAWKESVIWSAHVSHFVALSHQPFTTSTSSSSLFLLPRHQNTHYGRDNTIYSKNTQWVINLFRNTQSNSNAIKTGVKTDRVTETRAKHSPQNVHHSVDVVHVSAC